MSRLLTIAFLVGVAAVLGWMPAFAGSEGVEITKGSGGPAKTVLSAGIVLNDGSTLNREYIAIKHQIMPVKLKGTPGIRTVYESGRSSSGGRFFYTANLEVEVTEPVTAIEIQFLTFDVWGEHAKTLNLAELKDVATGTHKLEGKWNLFSENDASEYYASIAYVSRVRTEDGRVIAADVGPVVEEAKRLSAKFTEKDLEPEKRAQQPN